VVIEAGSQSLWIQDVLAKLGHEVLVVDPRRVKAIAQSDRKTDRRDAETLARLALGVPELLGQAQHRTLATQADLSILRSRDVLVGTRTRLVSHVRGILKAFGIHVPSCSASYFHRRAASCVPDELQQALQPILSTLATLECRIRELERSLRQLAEDRYPAANMLRQVSGVGPLVSIAFVLTIGDPSRFRRSRDVGAWAGLVPKKRASGKGDPQLRISKRGDAFLRRLLVIAAQYILGPFGKDSDLRRYGLRLCERGGGNAKKRATVAVARKLAVLLHRLWVSGAAYEPLRNSNRKEVA
jgi:transposase